MRSAGEAQAGRRIMRAAAIGAVLATFAGAAHAESDSPADAAIAEADAARAKAEADAARAKAAAKARAMAEAKADIMEDERAKAAASAEEEAAARKEWRETEKRSRKADRRTNAGSVLIGLGLVAGFASIPLFVYGGDCKQGPLCGGATYGGALLAAAGAALLGVGISLTIVGSSKGARRSTATQPWVELGAGTAQVGLRF